MYKIFNKIILCDKIISYDIYAPDIAQIAQAGQFIIIRLKQYSERIPLTIAGINKKHGLIKIIFQIIGKSTMELASLSKGAYIKDILGPLGNPTNIIKHGTIVAIAGGIGVAEIIPVLKEFKKIGNTIISIVGVRNKSLIICETELRKVSHSILFTTNDGTYGHKGFVTDVLKETLAQNKIDMVYTVGPLLMMKAVSEITKKQNIPTLVSMNTIMLDGTGMCGSCRLTVDQSIKFVCTDGPEFNAHSINWDEVISRLKIFNNLEKIANDRFKFHKECKCHKQH
ncbi:MAG: sulfide/dihydroorotate dehydrogenase-like FAD/NAD-binding protein [Endomicrobium sp.]|nr:sulfide/dihydroorotate dehydrogenase-like FAD/NAD-binding protein [Endomicrobium sp.]